MYLGALASSNEIQQQICRLLLESGSEVSPRGMNTREALGVSFDLTKPRNRLTTIRRWDPALAVGELAWHLRGNTSVDALAHYAKRWRDFADSDGQVRGSCYGAKIFNSTDESASQWDNVKSLLRKDIGTRRAVLNFRSEADVSEDTKDLSCTNSIQFICRDRKLHAFVSMRSNDAIWGVPYDIFLFTSLHELMATELGVSLGEYHHHAASMHVYERHFEVAEKMASATLFEDGEMPGISAAQEMFAIGEIEQIVRTRGRLASMAPFTDYQRCCLQMLDVDVPFQFAA